MEGRPSKRFTRMDTGRKRPTISWSLHQDRVDGLEKKLARQAATIRRLRRNLHAEEKKWFEKCPKGHFLRHDECDLVTCYVTPIEPPGDVFASAPKTAAPGTVHEWSDPTPDRPWWVRLWCWFFEPVTDAEHAKRAVAAIKRRAAL